MNPIEIVREAYSKNEISYDQLIRMELLVASNLKAKEKDPTLMELNGEGVIKKNPDLIRITANSSIAAIGTINLMGCFILF